ncbi:MAG: hypothetical protein V2I33_24630, partial [Kangiellaceae bacterium]|nr:hypothetical protein [Kangiellaceae bacterium]
DTPLVFKVRVKYPGAAGDANIKVEIRKDTNSATADWASKDNVAVTFTANPGASLFDDMELPAYDVTDSDGNLLAPDTTPIIRVKGKANSETDSVTGTGPTLS